MRSAILTGLLIGALALVPMESRTQPAPDPPVHPNGAALYCAWVVVVVVMGTVVIRGIMRLCDRIMSNRNYQLTNIVEGANYLDIDLAPNSTIQTARGIGQGWVDGYSFNVWQVNNTVYCTLSKDGVDLATNSAVLTSNECTVTFDFREQTRDTNRPSAQFFRVTTP